MLPVTGPSNMFTYVFADALVQCGGTAADGEVRRTLQRNLPALLDLFKGTGSIGRAFEARGWAAWTSCPNSHPPFAATFCAGTTAPPSRPGASTLCGRHPFAPNTPRRSPQGPAGSMRGICQRSTRCWEVVRGAQPGVPGPAPGRLGARDFFEAPQGETGGARRGGEAEDPGRAGRQVRAVRLRADGRLRAGPRGAGEAGLCGQRANSAGAVRRLPQREDAARERAARAQRMPYKQHVASTNPRRCIKGLVLSSPVCGFSMAQSRGAR